MDIYQQFKKEKKAGILKIPALHPNANYQPDLSCKTCKGTGYKFIEKRKFKILKSDIEYGGYYLFKCACIHFSPENKELAVELLKKTMKKTMKKILE